ncbi:MAG TPA: acyl-CoA dehydrogenase [Methylomirabilota bacterium]|nr:acyl-CoA dehydrogenase [Methylomirabilota bacterium]
MDFAFSQEQEMLRTTARNFLEKECPTSVVRKLMAMPEGATPELWAKLAELGWLGLIYPEAYDGAGLGFVDLTVVMEEMGRVLLPTPYFSTVLLGGLVLLEGGSEALKKEWLTKISMGEARVTLAWQEAGGRWDAAGIALSAKESGGSFTLNGAKLFVPDAHTAGLLVVAARTSQSADPSNGVSLFLVAPNTPGVTVELLPTMDETRKLGAVTFANVKVNAASLLGDKHGGWPILSKVIDKATVALSAEMCGGASRLLEMCTEYAKTRTTFGKPIGSYQAVKHKVADMLLHVENAKSITYYAAWAVDEGVREAAMAASMAKAYTSDAYRKIAADSIQLHGGIGFTWEHDAHLYFKRAKSSEFTFGNATYHRERIAQLIPL